MLTNLFLFDLKFLTFLDILIFILTLIGNNKISSIMVSLPVIGLINFDDWSVKCYMGLSAHLCYPLQSEKITFTSNEDVIKDVTSAKRGALKNIFIFFSV